MLKIDDQAPDFSLPDQSGRRHSLLDYSGRYLLIYFYPKDNTSGCTVEACSFRDAFPDFLTDNFAVLGVSADSVESHVKFAQKLNLPFPLLADTEKKMINNFGVWREKNMMGKKYMGIVRASFLIDPQGKIAKIYDPVKPEVHAQEVLDDVHKLSSKD